MSNHTVILRLNTSDLQSMWQIFYLNEYKPVIDLMHKAGYTKESAPFIIDGGAYIGMASLYFLEHFSDAKIWAFEADIENNKLLFDNTRFHNNINSFWCAIYTESNKNVKSVFSEETFADWAKQIEILPDTRNRSLSTTRTIQQIMEQADVESIDLLKLDIEGTERFLFENQHTASFLKRTKFLAIEIHERQYPGTEALVLAQLQHYNFEYFTQGETLFAYNKNLINL